MWLSWSLSHHVVTYIGLSSSLAAEDPNPSIPSTLGLPEPTCAPPCNPSQWTKAGEIRFRASFPSLESPWPLRVNTRTSREYPGRRTGRPPSPALFPGPSVASCSGKAVARRLRYDDWTGGAQGSREPWWPP